MFVLGCNLALMGDRQGALEIIARLDAFDRSGYVDPFLIVSIRSYLGDADGAFAAMDRAYAERSYWMTTLRVHPIVDGLRDDPRFAAYLERLRLE